jgi:TRAP-type C4-dicarboxylate transport system substrate-binding protein
MTINGFENKLHEIVEKKMYESKKYMNKLGTDTYGLFWSE